MTIEDDLPPERLYRYISWQKPYQRRLLTHNEIYLAKASSFNDPFDCQFEIIWPDDPVVLRESLERLAPRYPGHRDSRDSIDSRVAEILAPGFEEKEWRRRRDLTAQGWGIFCLSGIRSDLLMWSHYADSHRGVCVGFSSVGLEEVGNRILDVKGFGSDIFKVEYSSRLPVFDPTAPPPAGQMPPTAVRTKSKDWRYEEEFRFVVGLKDNARTWCYPDHALVEVILGCMIHPAHEQEMVEILQRKNPRPALFKAVIRRGEYALDFHPVEY